MPIKDLTPLPEVPSSKDSNFASKMRQFHLSEKQMVNELNIAFNDLEVVESNCKSYRDETENFKIQAENAKNSAYAYKIDAENAANRAESVVIPTEATYALNDLEIALNGLLTQLVAQQAQISILKS